MSAEIANRLRELALDHHEGRLDLVAYRALRGPLLDSLATSTGVAQAMEVTQPRVAAHRQMQRDAITRPGKPRVAGAASPDAPLGAHDAPGAQNTQGTPSGTRDAPSSTWGASAGQRDASPESQDAVMARLAIPLVSSKRLHHIAIFIAIAIVVVIAGVLWAWFDRSSTGHDGGSDGSGAGSTGAAATPAPGAVKNALEPFMDSGDWSEGRLTTLNAALMELGGEQIAIVAHDPWFQHFVDELRRRLKEQQALSPTTLTVDNSPLAALAVTVGLDLNSPDSALHISAIPAPVVPDSAQASATRASESPATQRRVDGHASDPVAEGHDTDAAPQAAPQAAPAVSPNTVADTQGATGAGADTRATAAVAGTNASPGVYAAATTTNPDACRPELIHSRRPLCHDTLPTGAEAPLMALVPAGAFDMGSTAAPEEQPVHHVTLGDPFAVSVYEVSQGEFKQYCESTRRQCASQPWQGDDYPVVNVSWEDARAYTEWLSSVTHHHYGLPTEAQWEYAARAGNAGPFPSGTSLSPTDANFSMQKKQTDAARRSQKFNANAFRLVHTVGNVREWVEDPWYQSFNGAPSDGTAPKSIKPAMRVVRGGSYTDGSARLRLSMREGLPPDTRDVTTGFRVVRELP